MLAWPCPRVARTPYRTPEDAAHAARFFDGYDAAHRVWHAIVEEARTWGPVEVTATKSRVCLKGRTRFAWCPQAHKAGTLFLRFWSTHPVESREGLEVRNETADDGRTSVRVRLAGPDPEAMAWLREAYWMDVA